MIIFYHGNAHSQRRIKIKVVIENNSQTLDLKVHCKKGDLINFSDNFKWAINPIDTSNIDRISISRISLPKYEASALFIYNDSVAFQYEYDEMSSGLDSLKFAYLEEITKGYHSYAFIAGNSKKNYHYEIPIWINPKILETKPTHASFHLRVIYDQMKISKEEILNDECKIIYRRK